MVSINRKDLIRSWFSHQYRLNFFGIPKTGSTTVRDLMQIRPQDWRELPSDELPDYLTFTVLRDPVARAVSSYWETMRRGTFKGDFDQFLTRLEYFGTFDNHCLPQTWYLEQAKELGTVPDVYLICNRNLVARLGALCGTEFKPIYSNKSTGTIEPTKMHVRQIKALYKKDFSLYEKIRAATEVQKTGVGVSSGRADL